MTKKSKIKVNDALLLGLQLAQMKVKEANEVYAKVMDDIGMKTGKLYNIEEDGDSKFLVEITEDDKD